MNIKYIYVTFQKEGIHKFPAAATDPNFATGGWDDVSFLAQDHRHIFHFKVKVEVTHNDRDIEFIQLKRYLERCFTDNTIKLDYKSCEMIAEDIYDALCQRYDCTNRDVLIDVSEDGENGAELHFPAAISQSFASDDCDYEDEAHLDAVTDARISLQEVRNELLKINPIGTP